MKHSVYSLVEYKNAVHLHEDHHEKTPEEENNKENKEKEENKEDNYFLEKTSLLLSQDREIDFHSILCFNPILNINLFSPPPEC